VEVGSMTAGVDPTAMTAFNDTRLVLDAVDRAIVVTDASGRIVGWNAAAHRLYGWSAAEVTGRQATDVLIRNTDADTARDVLNMALRGGTWRGDASVLRGDGDTVLVAAVMGPLRDAEGTIVGAVGWADDVTEQRLAEQRAADLTEHFRLALDAGRLGTWRWDKATGAVTWDATMERLYGLAPGTFPGTYDAWRALRGREEETTAAVTLDQAMDSREPYEIETRVVWPDGSEHWLLGRGRVTVDGAGRVTGAIGCTADITERKAAELAAGQRARDTVEEARLERLQHDRLAFLARISEAAMAASDHHELMTTVARDAVPTLGDWCALHFVPEPGAQPDVVVAHNDPAKVAWIEQVRAQHRHDPAGRTGVAAVMRTGRAEFIPEVDETFIAAALATTDRDRDEARRIVEALNLTSVITVPLVTKRGVLGAMQFVTAESRRRYDHEDLALAEAAAGRVGEALDNMWLTGQQRHIATTLQTAFLPPELPTVPGIGVAARYWPTGAGDVGGDFYDLFPIGERCWAVVIGDVCGTGADAAAVTVITRHTIRAAARHGIDHRGVLDWLNDAVRHSGRNRFCTALYGTLELVEGRTWQLTTISGGHPLPVVARAGGAVETVGAPGTLIGVFPTLRNDTHTTVLDQGDTVVLYTDGVTDLPPPHGRTAADVERLVGCCAHRSATADETATAIGDEVASPEGSRHADDVALLVLRVGEGAASPASPPS
jgi:PAS domain S-box-containing protein